MDTFSSGFGFVTNCICLRKKHTHRGRNADFLLRALHLKRMQSSVALLRRHETQLPLRRHRPQQRRYPRFVPVDSWRNDAAATLRIACPSIVSEPLASTSSAKTNGSSFAGCSEVNCAPCLSTATLRADGSTLAGLPSGFTAVKKPTPAPCLRLLVGPHSPPPAPASQPRRRRQSSTEFAVRSSSWRHTLTR